MNPTTRSNRLPDPLVEPTTLLRLEGIAVASASLGAYAAMGGGWQVLLLLLFAPDVSMLAYLAGPRRGAAVYNLFHSYVGPLLLGFTAWLVGSQPLLLASLVWLGHIGIDRTLGYGLKLPTSFKETHLGAIGRGAPVPVVRQGVEAVR